MKEFIKEEIDGLARIIAKSFDHVEARFGKTDQKIDSVYRELKSDIVDLKSDIVELKSNIVGVDRKVDSVYQELKSDISEVKMTVNRIELQTRNHGDAVYEEMSDVRKETKKEIEMVKEDILAVKTFVGMKAVKA